VPHAPGRARPISEEPGVSSTLDKMRLGETGKLYNQKWSELRQIEKLFCLPCSRLDIPDMSLDFMRERVRKSAGDNLTRFDILIVRKISVE
jgi:hypothetical protein